MKERLVRKGLVFGIIILFVGASIPVVNAHTEKTSKNVEINLADIEKYIEPFDEEVQQRIHQALDNGLSVYITISTSDEMKAFHIFFPLLIRILQPHGIFFAAFIFYRSIFAETTVLEFNKDMLFPEIIHVYGRHVVFLIGIGYTEFDSPFFSGPGALIAVSLTKPIVCPSS